MKKRRHSWKQIFLSTRCIRQILLLLVVIYTQILHMLPCPTHYNYHPPTYRRGVEEIEQSFLP
jgi:hypothetical protein